MDEIQELLAAATDRDSNNRLTLQSVRTWLAEYVEARSDDVLRFGSDGNLCHWDMIVADFDPSEDAQFLAAAFRDDQVFFLAGRGPAGELKRFAESSFPADASEVLDELTRKFVSERR